MKRRHSTMLALACAVVILAGMQSQAHSKSEERTPPLVKQMYNGNCPSEEEAKQLLDELYYQRAIYAYMTMLPALNTTRTGFRL